MNHSPQPTFRFIGVRLHKAPVGFGGGGFSGGGGMGGGGGAGGGW